MSLSLKIFANVLIKHESIGIKNFTKRFDSSQRHLSLDHHHHPHNTRSQTTMVTHVQFDFDGTLVNTIDGLIAMFAGVARNRGKELTPTFIDSIPNFGRKLSPFELLDQELGIRLTRDELVGEMRQFAVTTKFSLLPGVERLVRHLHRHQIPMAVATGNFSKLYLSVTKHFGDFFPEHFSHAVCGHDDPEVKINKPGPEVYHVCAKRFINPPVTDMSKVLIFEDSITGLTGAVESGAKTVLIASKKTLESSIFQKNESLVKKATLVIESMEHFRPEMFGLPEFSEIDQEMDKKKSESISNQIGG